jgi:hypothetical protein
MTARVGVNVATWVIAGPLRLIVQRRLAERECADRFPWFIRSG